MDDQSKPAELGDHKQPADPASKNSVNDVTARGNVHSEEGNEPELDAAEAHPS